MDLVVGTVFVFALIFVVTRAVGRRDDRDRHNRAADRLRCTAGA
jgi:hypothetical protein